MADITTCAVKAIVHSSNDGPPVAGAQLQLQLSAYDIYQGFVTPPPIRGVTDANGECVLELFPNELGQAATFYKVTIAAEGKTFRSIAVVPNQPTALLHEITAVPPYDGKPDGYLVLARLEEMFSYIEAVTPKFLPNAPTNPLPGSRWTDADTGKTYEWVVTASSSAWFETGSAETIGYETAIQAAQSAADAADSAVDAQTAEDGAKATLAVFASAAPASPLGGLRWTSAITGKTYEFIVDANSSQWVETGSAQTVSATAFAAALASPATLDAYGYTAAQAQSVLDNALPMQGYTALRAYTGRAVGVRITTPGVAGNFYLDTSDTTTADNGVTVIVDASGRRWKRIYLGPVNAQWAGAIGDGAFDNAAALARLAALSFLTNLYFPAGIYRTTSGATFPQTFLAITGDGSGIGGAGGAVSVIRLVATNPNSIAINATGYCVPLSNIAIESSGGVSDGLATVGFQHARVNNGSTGRLTHRNVRISGFSYIAMKVHQAINYSLDTVSLTGGRYNLWIGRSLDGTQVSTTVSLYDVYLSTGTEANLYLDRLSDFSAHRLICEYGGSSTYPNSAAIINDLSSPLTLNTCYFEACYRNINTNSALVQINTNAGPATNADIFSYNAGITAADRGSTSLKGNRLTTRWINADPFTGILELPDTTRLGVHYGAAKYVNSAGPITLGTSSELGLMGGERILRLASNMNSGGGFAAGDPGQSIEFGVSNSSVATTSRWFKVFHTRTDNSTNSSLNFASNSGTTYNAPDGAQSIKFTINSNNTIYPGSDNAISLGIAANRWSQVYAATGTINTSDATAKQQIRGLSDVEREVALHCKGLIRAFKFNDAVEEKGASARWHFGVIAQEIRDVFVQAGLSAEAYGLLCYDEWGELPEVVQKWEEERDEAGEVTRPAGSVVVQLHRPAGSRYGVRYEELLAFIIAAI